MQLKTVVLVRPGYSDRIYGALYEQNKNTRREIRPPLGLMALAGYLKSFGHNVHIVDGEPELLSVADTVSRALAFKPDIVGVTATTPEYPFACDMFRNLKQANRAIETVLGGSHITNLPEHTIEDLGGDLDWGVLYEGEKPMAAIASGDARDFCWKPGASSKLLIARERLSDYRTAYNMIDELRIVKRGSFIIDHPHETESTIKDSIDFAIELDLDEIGVNIMTPYPGQETFRDAYGAKGIWFAHEIHYIELRERRRIGDTWKDFKQVNWHDYWIEHLRWGNAVVETETLSREALVYWHGRFLQEVYGSERMRARRLRQIERGNNDDYWHRPWRVHSERGRRRLEQEQGRTPSFPKPLHAMHTYQPLFLRDYQKNELYLAPRKRMGGQASEMRLSLS